MNEQGNFSYPSQIQDAQKAMSNLVTLLTEVTNVLVSLRRELRGEALWQDEAGNPYWIQVTKPAFVKMDFKLNKPIKIKKMMPWKEEVDVYLPNDEAIEEILSQLKSVGVNQITAISGISQDNYLDDLKEYECKLAAVLCLKQKEWGIDKELLPMLQTKLKTVIQDARSLALEGRTLKALQTTVQRVEHMMEETRKKKEAPSPF